MIGHFAYIFQKVVTVPVMLFSIAMLRNSSASDNIHYLLFGYGNIAAFVAAWIALLQPREGYSSEFWNWSLIATSLCGLAVASWYFLSLALDAPYLLGSALVALAIVVPLHLPLLLPDILRRNRKFTLRRMLLFVLAIAVCGTLLGNAFHSRIRRYNAEKPIVDAIMQLGGGVMYKDWAVNRVNVGSINVSDAELSYIADLKNIETLDISRMTVTEARLATILRMRSLKEIYMSQAVIDQKSMDRIQKELPRIRVHEH